MWCMGIWPISNKLNSAFSFIHCIPSLTNFYQPCILRLLVCPLLSPLLTTLNTIATIYFSMGWLTINSWLCIQSCSYPPTYFSYSRQNSIYTRQIWHAYTGKFLLFLIFHILSINIFKIYCKVGVARWGGKEGEITKRREKLKATWALLMLFSPPLKELYAISKPSCQFWTMKM